jgi:hypothetical protein
MMLHSSAGLEDTERTNQIIPYRFEVKKPLVLLFSEYYEGERSVQNGAVRNECASGVFCYKEKLYLYIQ